MSVRDYIKRQERVEDIRDGIIGAITYIGRSIECYEQVRRLPNCDSCSHGHVAGKPCEHKKDGGLWMHVNCPHYEKPAMF